MMRSVALLLATTTTFTLAACAGHDDDRDASFGDLARSEDLSASMNDAASVDGFPEDDAADGSTAGPYEWPSFASIFSAGMSFKHEGCNTVSYGTTPNFGNLMIGRVMNGDPITQGMPSACANGSKTYDTHESLTAVSMDFVNRQVDYLYKVLDTSAAVSIEDGANQIISAYDASIVPLEGEYWVAFECAIGVTASCIGPLTWNASQLQMDVSRVSVVVSGFCVAGDTCKSASAPKLLVVDERLYMYWNELTSDDHNPRRQENDWTLDSQEYFMADNVRGAELALDPTTKRMYVRGHVTAIQEDDADTAQVLPNVGLAQVIAVGPNLIATGGLTVAGTSIDTTCAMPLNDVPNCYRLFFAQSQSPLGPFTFIPSESGGVVSNPNDGLPAKPASYNHFMYRQDTGGTVFMGGVFYAITTPMPDPSYVVVSELYDWSSPLLAPVCDPITQPFPTYVENDGKCVPRP